MKKFCLCVVGIMYCLGAQLKAQDNLVSYPKIGERIRDFTFNDLVNYEKPTVSLRDLRGKWLVLDFWSRYCTSCIASFPTMKKLQTQFKDSVKLLFVGAYSNQTRNGYTEEEQIKTLFDKQAKKHNLTFTVAFDSTVQKAFDLRYVPTILVISPEGMIVGKATKIDSADLVQLMSGKDFKYKRAYSLHEDLPSAGYDKELPLLTTGQTSNGGIDTAFLFRSLLTKWSSDMPPYYYSAFMEKKSTAPFSISYEIFGMDIPSLLRIAYFGKESWGTGDSLYNLFPQKIIIEAGDTLKFGLSDRKTNRNIYAYSLSYGNRVLSAQTLRNYLLQDIERYFNFQSALEERNIQAWSLIVIDHEKAKKLMTKRFNTRRRTNEVDGVILEAAPIGNLIALLNQSLRIKLNTRVTELPPIFDKTNIESNIDIHLKADFRDFDAIRRELQRNGLDLILSNVMMKCIVVRDSD